MTKLEIAVSLSDVVNNINALKAQIEAIQEALYEAIDWDALEGPENQPER